MYLNIFRIYIIYIHHVRICIRMYYSHHDYASVSYSRLATVSTRPVWTLGHTNKQRRNDGVEEVIEPCSTQHNHRDVDD